MKTAGIRGSEPNKSDWEAQGDPALISQFPRPTKKKTGNLRSPAVADGFLQRRCDRPSEWNRAVWEWKLCHRGWRGFDPCPPNEGIRADTRRLSIREQRQSNYGAIRFGHECISAGRMVGCPSVRRHSESLDQRGTLNIKTIGNNATGPGKDH